MKAGKRTLQATVGSTAAALLLSHVPQFEGMILRGHLDPIGIVTACAGHTKTAVLGKPYTREQCNVLLEQDLVEHAEPVLRCTPGLRDKPFMLAAAISFTFNVGGPKYCASSIARAFNAGQYSIACERFNQKPNGDPQWVYAGGIVFPGLVTRRRIERSICEQGLAG